MAALIPGFLAGLGLIVAIGAQNAYVLRLGLARNHVGVAVGICAASDALLILAGTAGIGAVVERAPVALEVLRWLGVAYLSLFAVKSLRSALRPAALSAAAGGTQSLRAVVASTMVFTYLNPHVYLDTVLFLGSLGQQYGDSRWWFAAGAAAASLMWFSALGFGARAAAPLMSRPRTWQVLDSAIAAVMLAIAWQLATSAGL